MILEKKHFFATKPQLSGILSEKNPFLLHYSHCPLFDAKSNQKPFLIGFGLKLVIAEICDGLKGMFFETKIMWISKPMKRLD
jgi:hypothetical protein